MFSVQRHMSQLNRLFYRFQRVMHSLLSCRILLNVREADRKRFISVCLPVRFIALTLREKSLAIRSCNGRILMYIVNVSQLASSNCTSTWQTRTRLDVASDQRKIQGAEGMSN